MTEIRSEEEKSYTIIIGMALMMHVVFTIIFAINKIPWLPLYNAGSIVFYIAMLLLVRKNHYRTAIVCIHLEVSVFVIISTIVLGSNCGFPIYMIAMASLMYFNPFRDKEKIYILLIMEFIIFLFMIMYTDGFYSLDYSKEIYFKYFNCVASFIIVFSGMVVSKIATERLVAEHSQLTRDRLTGIYNREYFMEMATERLEENDKPYMLLCSNISGFKFYNELFGAEKGNQVLIREAQMLREMCGSYTVFGRLSGDEFGILIPRENYSEDTLMKHKLRFQEQFSNSQYHMHMLVGVYEILDRTESVAVMCEKARIAMTRVKGDLERHFSYYDESLLEESLMKSRVLGEFENALKTGQFCMYLQPQVAKDGSILGAEALVRWKHPKDGLISPGVFIPILEKNGLISRLDRYIWEQAAALLAQWKQEGRGDMTISVNVSAKDFYCMDTYKVFTELVERYGISPKNLKIEITETVLMKEAKKQMALFQKLRSYGFEMEIDDFGSGYSSLNMLKDFFVDVLKIDMGFLEETENVERSWAIIKAVADLADTLGIQTIVEGVETEEQVIKLDAIGCTMFQGFYFARPMDVESFAEKYMSNVAKNNNHTGNSKTAGEYHAGGKSA